MHLTTVLTDADLFPGVCSNVEFVSHFTQHQTEKLYSTMLSNVEYSSRGLNPFTPKSTVPKIKIQDKIISILFCKKNLLQIVPCESTPEEVSFEWSHHRISFIDFEVTCRITFS